MAQHDYNIANQSGADFRADLNNALSAIVTVNSGATEPSTTFAHQLWVDTANSVLKIRNAADNAWITTGVSITASNTFTGDLTGNVVGNVTGNLVGDVTGDLTGNADTATTLATARTISLSGDVAGSASFDGSGDITISTTAQINSIALGTDTTGDYVESMSGGTGVTVTGGTGEGSTPSVAIGQAVATTDDVTFNTITATDQFIGDIRGAVRFNAKADGALTKGDVVYISGVSGNTPTVGKAKADDASKMPAFGIAVANANANASVQIVTFGTLTNLNTSSVSEGQVLYVSTTAGAYTTTPPTGESAQIQNIGKVQKSDATTGSIKVGGAGRSNATPNLNDGKIFIGNASNQSSTATLDTSIVVENTNLYYTTTRANTDFDTRLATKDTGDLTEGTNLYYTTARANTDFDTRLATKSTTNLAEGTNLYYTSARFDSAFTAKDTDDLSEGLTNLYYTTARFDSAFGNKDTDDLSEGTTNLYYTDARANSAIDTRVTKAFVDALGIQASSVDANSVALGTDTTGNYVQTITGTANKITVTGSGSESADVTLTLPDDVQIADSLTVAGNLTVNGTLTSLDTTNLDIEDNLFQLNAGLTGSPVNDSGMLINRGTADNGIFMWDESVDKFTLGLTTADGTSTGNITLNSLGTLVANIEGDVTGDVTGTVSSLSNHDTGDLAEGTNLYYTQARFDSAFTGKSTSDLSEGTNLYYTDARFDTRLATKSTSDLSEGSNLYYTDARAQAVSINNVVEDTTPQLGGDLASNGNDILFADSDKAIFGAGSDLQIYHDSTSGDSRIVEGGTGHLALWGNNIKLLNAAGTETMLDANPNAAVTLYYDDAAKLATTSTGIDVTGEIVGDGLDITDSASDIAFLRSSNATTSNVYITNTNATTGNTANLYLAPANNVAGSQISSIAIEDFSVSANRTADLAFSTRLNGTMSERMRIDSSGQVGIGTSSPSTELHVKNAADCTLLLQSGDGSTAEILFGDASDSSRGKIKYLSTDEMTFEVNNLSEAMRINSSGNVGIGTTSPSAKLDVYQGELKVTGTLANWSVDSQGVVMDFTRASTSYIRASNAAGQLQFQTGGSNNRMIINSSGNVGIGTSSPSVELDVRDDGANGICNIGVRGGTNGAGAVQISGHGTTYGTDSFDIIQNSAGGYVYNRANLPVIFGTNNTERMRIDSSGNVGIGTTNPGVPFDVNGAIRTKNSSSAILYLNNISTQYAIQNNGNDLTIGRDGLERMRIDSSGNVGIGNDNPHGLLHLEDSSTVHIIGTNTGADGNTGTTCMELIGQARGYNNDISRIASIEFRTDTSTWYRGNILFNVADNDGTNKTLTPLEAMRIESTGNVLLQNGVPIQAGASGRATSLSIAATNTNALNFNTLGGTDASRGFYLVTAVRSSASVGTSIVLLIGVSTSGASYIYDTIYSNGFVATMSGSWLQLRNPSGTVTAHVTAVPIGITGRD